MFDNFSFILFVFPYWFIGIILYSGYYYPIMCIIINFSHSVACIFTIYGVFCLMQFLYFNVFKFSLFSFLLLSFCLGNLKKCNEDILLNFLFNFKNFPHTFEFLIHVSCLFVTAWNRDLNAYLLPVYVLVMTSSLGTKCLMVATPCWHVKPSLSHAKFPYMYWSVLTYFVHYAPLALFYILDLIPHYLNYCGLIVSLVGQTSTP